MNTSEKKKEKLYNPSKDVSGESSPLYLGLRDFSSTLLTHRGYGFVFMEVGEGAFARLEEYFKTKMIVLPLLLPFFYLI